MSSHPDHPAYYMRYDDGVRRVAWFCRAEDVEEFFFNGIDYETLSSIGTEPEPGATYRDEGHFYCNAEDCPEWQAKRDAAFAAHADESLALANEAFDAVVETWPKE